MLVMLYYLIHLCVCYFTIRYTLSKHSWLWDGSESVIENLLFLWLDSLIPFSGSIVIYAVPDFHYMLNLFCLCCNVDLVIIFSASITLSLSLVNSPWEKLRWFCNSFLFPLKSLKYYSNYVRELWENMSASISSHAFELLESQTKNVLFLF